mmetsp:Transcript_550/g.1163  ORF Transcript_550/g.1163 Transcript_550/m.1163 type:complete len:201 (+) Transcript_550:84-686(+)
MYVYQSSSLHPLLSSSGLAVAPVGCPACNACTRFCTAPLSFSHAASRAPSALARSLCVAFKRCFNASISVRFISNTSRASSARRARDSASVLAALARACASSTIFARTDASSSCDAFSFASSSATRATSASFSASPPVSFAAPPLALALVAITGAGVDKPDASKDEEEEARGKEASSSRTSKGGGVGTEAASASASAGPT